MKKLILSSVLIPMLSFSAFADSKKLCRADAQSEYEVLIVTDSTGTDAKIRSTTSGRLAKLDCSQTIPDPLSANHLILSCHENNTNHLGYSFTMSSVNSAGQEFISLSSTSSTGTQFLVDLPCHPMN